MQLYDRAIARWVSQNAPAVIRMELEKPGADTEYVSRLKLAIQSAIACGNKALAEAFPELNFPGMESHPKIQLVKALEHVESLLNYGGFYVGQNGFIRLEVSQGTPEREEKQMRLISEGFKDLAEALKNNISKEVA